MATRSYKEPLGPSWGLLGRSWSRLKVSWAPLGAVLGPLGAVLGPQTRNQSKSMTFCNPKFDLPDYVYFTVREALSACQVRSKKKMRNQAQRADPPKCQGV